MTTFPALRGSSARPTNYLSTSTGIMTDPEKEYALNSRRSPRNVKEVLSFLQACSWYRRFIPSFADTSKPLSALSKKNAV